MSFEKMKNINNEQAFDDYMGEMTGNTWSEILLEFKEEYTDEEIYKIKSKWLTRYYKHCEKNKLKDK